MLWKMKTNSMTEVLDLQKFLIWGFIEYWYAQDYKDVIPSKLFGVYEPMFLYLSEFWNARTPKYYEVMRKVWSDDIIKAIERGDTAFILSRDKYIEQLYSWYVSNVLIKEKDPTDILESIKDTYVKLSYIKSWTRWWITKIDNLLYNLQDEIEEAISYGDRQFWYKTGIKSIDDITSWVVKWRTMRVSAYSNTGKSALSYSVTNSLLKQGAKVLYFSLEIPKEDLRNRLLSNYYQIPIHKFEKKSMLEWLDMSWYAEKQLYISSDAFHISEIEDISRTIKPDVIVIDYIQLIKADWSCEYDQMNDVARRIRKLTSELNTAVFDLSQVSNEGKEYKKWSVIPTKGSGELVAAANIVLVMTESKEFPWRINVDIAKNRHWKKGMCVELKPNFETSTFEEVWSTNWWTNF